ncbi:tetraacyldisaccharide 4'-kinase [Lutibacter sp.]|uniref:tetraacyldisaccharide 4'-kinase n=1 Tax=Lutibacter sp. TaxID=1925666 RepID=UPI0025C051EE|nr:tetraacyldisaccharide 4'-kinase [Lutibacter sp.]MCF6182088.1 tetraacyldisaccharide 4'-kinase [Lutibacter sp.]
MNLIRKIAFPFSFIYKWMTSFRNYLFDIRVLKSTKFDIPTIVVGNLSVGGTGKTPQIEYLIRLLSEKYTIAVLSRGYKRKSKGFIIADETSNAEMIGDEPFQYFQKFKNISVCVDADRVHGIQQILKLKLKVEVVLLDDAFQHRKIEGGLNILLTSYDNLYCDDSILPSGNLRESVVGSRRAQLIVVTKCPNKLTEDQQFEIAKKLNPSLYQTIFFSSISYDTVLKGDHEITITDLQESEILLVTGIENPTPLLNYLEKNEIKYRHLKFKDHHHFSNQDIVTINNEFNQIKSNKKIVLTTEKDYVRIFEKLPNVNYIAIKTKFINHKKDFDNLINTYVESSTRNR